MYNINTYIKTGRPEFDNLIPMVKAFLENGLLDVVIDGQNIRGYRSPDAKSIWIRDYSDMLRGVKYFEKDIKSTVQHFADTQSAGGRIFDYFTTFPEKLPCERENWTKYVRVPVEADVEFRFVKAAFLAWQATGDDSWLANLLPSLEKSLQYILNSPQRWNEELGLVKRPYTIDTWDFAYTAGRHKWLQFQIDDNTFWGIMHGDNSGYYEAFQIMSKLYLHIGNNIKSEQWHETAAALLQAMNQHCWNGLFYTHFVMDNPVNIDGVDQSQQLSLSNPMDINRGTASPAMAESIIAEYIKRKGTSGSFAEWFSIDPPFPDGAFGDEKLAKGTYVNGGIMPLVGGELAKAAFNNGFEEYGADILRRYYNMIAKKNETYLWYHPDGTPATVESGTSPDAEPTDGWGSTAMLYAFIEGLAGVEDKYYLFRKITLSPRWPAADVSKAEVRVLYEASGSYIKYEYELKNREILIKIESPGSEIEFHVLLPKRTEAASVLIDNKPAGFESKRIRNSLYVDFNAKISNLIDEKFVNIEIRIFGID